MVKYKIVDWDEFAKVNCDKRDIPKKLLDILVEFFFKRAEYIEFDYVANNKGYKNGIDYLLYGVEKVEEPKERRTLDEQTIADLQLILDYAKHKIFIDIENNIGESFVITGYQPKDVLKILFNTYPKISSDVQFGNQEKEIINSEILEQLKLTNEKLDKLTCLKSHCKISL